jgi:predicted transcriptional regulator
MNMIDLAVFSEKRRNLLLLIEKELRRIEQAVQGLLISNYGETNKLIEVESSKLFVHCRNVNLPFLIVTDRFMEWNFSELIN